MPGRRVATSELEGGEIQELGDVVPDLLKVKTESGVPVSFRVSIEVGDGENDPPEEVVKKVNEILGNLKEGFGLK